MRRLALLFILVLLAPSAQANLRIQSITDGDTVKLASGKSIRLLQIDTPELRGNECYAREAAQELAKILAGPGALRISIDPKLDQIDAYGRLLRYLFIGRTNVNLEMVRRGAATPYFYRNELGKYSNSLLKAAKRAQVKKIGLWKKCPGTILNPYRALTTLTQTPSPSSSGTSACDPNYAGCIPLYPPDLNCDDIRRLGLAPVRVIGKDPHRLDSDGDGVGCS